VAGPHPPPLRAPLEESPRQGTPEHLCLYPPPYPPMGGSPKKPPAGTLVGFQDHLHALRHLQHLMAELDPPRPSREGNRGAVLRFRCVGRCLCFARKFVGFVEAEDRGTMNGTVKCLFRSLIHRSTWPRASRAAAVFFASCPMGLAPSCTYTRRPCQATCIGAPTAGPGAFRNMSPGGVSRPAASRELAACFF